MKRRLKIIGDNVNMLPLVVLDANSALFLSQIYINNSPILIQLIRKGRVQISNVVWDEYIRNFKVRDESAKELSMSLESCKNDANIRDCLDFIKAEARRYHIQTRRHRGELSAAALTLWLSRTTREQIILVTDDFKIHRLLSAMIGKQYAGNVFTSFDLILFLFTRLPELLKPNVEDLLRELLRLFPKPVDISKEHKAQIKFAVAWRRLSEICRYERCSNRSCYE